MVDQTVATYGRLDMAFNKAGVVGFTGDLADESAESFDKVTAVNLRGIWTCMKHELRQMRTQGSGAIVNCSSLGGLVGQAGRASYHATKHGVIGLTRSAAMDYAPRGIRINAVCPGVIDTPMSAAMGQDQAEAMKEILRDQPIGRKGRRGRSLAVQPWLEFRARRGSAGRRRLHGTLTVRRRRSLTTANYIPGPASMALDTGLSCLRPEVA